MIKPWVSYVIVSAPLNCYELVNKFQLILMTVVICMDNYIVDCSIRVYQSFTYHAYIPHPYLKCS